MPLLKLNQKELDNLRESLPDGGFKLVSAKLENISPESVRKILTEPRRYKSEVIDAAIEVVKEAKEKLAQQKITIKEVTS